MTEKIQEMEYKLTKFTQKTSEPGSPERHFKELKVLGQGSSGIVILTEIDGESFAIKYITENEEDDFYQIIDLDISRRIRHPNAIKSFYFIERVIENKNNIGIILPVANYDLETFIKKVNPDLETKSKIAYQLLSVIKTFHDNKLLHGDIKPENILIKDGEVLLIDYGLVHDFNVTFAHCITIYMSDPYKLDQYTRKIPKLHKLQTYYKT